MGTLSKEHTMILNDDEVYLVEKFRKARTLCDAEVLSIIRHGRLHKLNIIEKCDVNELPIHKGTAVATA